MRHALWVGAQAIHSLINGAASDYETGLARAEDGFEAAALDITDTWMIMYTSGTTGPPGGRPAHPPDRIRVEMHVKGSA